MKSIQKHGLSLRKCFDFQVCSILEKENHLVFAVILVGMYKGGFTLYILLVDVKFEFMNQELNIVHEYSLRLAFWLEMSLRLT